MSKIKLLGLNPNPDFMCMDARSGPGGSFLTMRSLATIRVYCPELESLGVYVDTGVKDFVCPFDDDDGVQDEDAGVIEPFGNLEELVIGGPGDITTANMFTTSLSLPN
ncbi:hypothetical protein CC1G_05618 [Coprinopsis cinerea okayama7|uniref:Uncharacterized protein n=1 Tax=Coprinopsis cinerea (strain Okayama-7 / 130 / ATCC MYA-4618 / FGSC 9003) TaxID=240176 RepID=A8P1N2_COPC7|nr:hypothetical protein CC1G_05618 [Coprinopsis cinerea okayama7\|eukprot:XP_001838137.2 hypothetical protein CC1G_05618 [Coprinopsis cinerea okayama7\